MSWIAIYHFYGKSIAQNIKHFLAWNHSEKDFLIRSWVIIRIIFLYLLKNKYTESLALFCIWNIPFYIVKPFEIIVIYLTGFSHVVSVHLPPRKMKTFSLISHGIKKWHLSHCQALHHWVTRVLLKIFYKYIFDFARRMWLSIAKIKLWHRK